tara:strand:+ start:160 stop:654 length:495 start_codon:yes stop_codon:yes gene_type:complete
MIFLKNTLNSIKNKDTLKSLLLAYVIYELCKAVGYELSEVLFNNLFDEIILIPIFNVNMNMNKLMKRVFLCGFIMLVFYLLLELDKPVKGGNVKITPAKLKENQSIKLAKTNPNCGVPPRNQKVSTPSPADGLQSFNNDMNNILNGAPNNQLNVKKVKFVKPRN